MPQDSQTLLTRLKSSGLDFVVIGGVCVNYYGVPIATFDLDVCCPFGAENVKRIESAVKDLHAIHRLTTNKLPLESTQSSFAEMKNLYLQTDIGKLDCLSEVLGVGSYADVRKRSVTAQLSYGEFHFLDVEALIEAKKAVGRPRDLEAVSWLTAIKEEKAKQKNLPDS
jgi:hypothetical protein